MRTTPGGYPGNIHDIGCRCAPISWKGFAASGEFFFLFFFFLFPLSMPLTPQRVTSRLSTFSDLSANADIAAKNANFDLKESNVSSVSSDKVEASVSEGMNFEDHEDECYGSDYESDGHHAFVGHVDAESVGCGREDEEYEDVSQQLTQLLRDGVGENNESSCKNAHSSGFSGVGGSHFFKNDWKYYRIPVHTESSDDFVKGCDEKADKIDHTDGKLLSPLFDKEKTTGDDEQRPIGAIHQGPVDQSGIPDVQEGYEKRYSDTEEEKFHLPRNRDEFYADGPKFVQDRVQVRSFGSSRGNFMRGRGRGSAGLKGSSHRGWNSGRDFERNRGEADYRFKHNRTAGTWESENERNDYDSRLDGAAFAGSRRRRPLNDLPSFRHPPAATVPNGREDAAVMGSQMLGRASRNISPSRCTGEDGSEYVGLRHSEKFVRDFPADISEDLFIVPICV
ncbi:hypothetical protein HAX54_051310 [Datura stramonium]|uniref:Btz domain-containing protein n=1 Tax=Datura stramonium TaxID=4076 RepID=A0ABS8SY63_DATST|nr:hypothetical protein [Datura stramonium]